MLAGVADRFQSQVAGIVDRVIETVGGMELHRHGAGAERRESVSTVLSRSWRRRAISSVASAAGDSDHLGRDCAAFDLSHHVASMPSPASSRQHRDRIADRIDRKIGQMSMIGAIASRMLLALNATIERRAPAAAAATVVASSEVARRSSRRCRISTGSAGAGNRKQAAAAWRRSGHDPRHRRLRRRGGGRSSNSAARSGNFPAARRPAPRVTSIYRSCATFAEVGNASGDIAARSARLERATLRAETETFLRDVLAA